MSVRAASTVARVPPLDLQRHAHQAVGARRILAEIMIDLIHFAAQAENDRRGDIGMVEDAGQRALQLLGIGADGLAAAFAVREGHDAVDIGRQRFVFEAGGDQLGSVRGAVAGGHHRDVVASADASILALVAKERRDVLAEAVASAIRRQETRRRRTSSSNATLCV